MKTIFNAAVVLICMLGVTVQIHAQCTPDTVNCKDEGEPGEFCPKALPDGTIDVAYDQTITVIPPPSAEVNQNQVNIEYIVIDSVKNLPPGINYHPNAEMFYPDTAYCIQIEGTPAAVGNFSLAIYVSVYVNIVGTIVKGGQVVNDTSVVMVVHSASGINPYNYREFKVLQNTPNPFSEITKMGFYTPRDDYIILEVYNIMGELLYQEETGYPPGEHFFEFDGSMLHPGTYFYRVKNSDNWFTGKFIKSR